jgi:hypothetical protein
MLIMNEHSFATEMQINRSAEVRAPWDGAHVRLPKLGFFPGADPLGAFFLARDCVNGTHGC